MQPVRGGTWVPVDEQVVVSASPKTTSDMVMLYIGVGDPLGEHLLHSTKDKVWAAKYVDLFKLPYRETVS